MAFQPNQDEESHSDKALQEAPPIMEPEHRPILVTSPFSTQNEGADKHRQNHQESNTLHSLHPGQPMNAQTPSTSADLEIEDSVNKEKGEDKELQDEETDDETVDGNAGQVDENAKPVVKWEAEQVIEANVDMVAATRDNTRDFLRKTGPVKSALNGLFIEHGNENIAAIRHGDFVKKTSNHLFAINYAHGRHAGTVGPEDSSLDKTSYLDSQKDWGSKREHRPAILFELRKPKNLILPNTVACMIRLVDGVERVVVDNLDGKVISDFAHLPDSISTEIEGWLLEAWSRQDPRVTMKDVIQRMPYTPNDGVNSSRVDNKLCKRRIDFRELGRCISWGRSNASRTCDQDLIDEINKNPDPQNPNSTRHLKDLTIESRKVCRARTYVAKEAKNMNRGRHHSLSEENRQRKDQEAKAILDEHRRKGGPSEPGPASQAQPQDPTSTSQPTIPDPSLPPYCWGLLGAQPAPAEPYNPDWISEWLSTQDVTKMPSLAPFPAPPGSRTFHSPLMTAPRAPNTVGSTVPVPASASNAGLTLVPGDNDDDWDDEESDDEDYDDEGYDLPRQQVSATPRVNGPHQQLTVPRQRDHRSYQPQAPRGQTDRTVSNSVYPDPEELQTGLTSQTQERRRSEESP